MTVFVHFHVKMKGGKIPEIFKLVSDFAYMFIYYCFL